MYFLGTSHVHKCACSWIDPAELIALLTLLLSITLSPVLGLIPYWPSIYFSLRLSLILPASVLGCAHVWSVQVRLAVTCFSF